MTDFAKRLYYGDGQQHYAQLPGAWNRPEPYRAMPEVVEAVNIALYLRRPLLLEGEPGCGKTRLAYSVAYELGYPLKLCYIRSTSRARDLQYTYDPVKRLYDIQEWRSGDSGGKPLPPREDYVTLGELGEAIKLSAEEDVPSVVLIDEIDKADIDFPNDLLLVLDRLQFQIEEAESRKEYDALKGQSLMARKHNLPLIIVTSNREKELPGPFLRRCLFHYIEFPKQDMLGAIVKSHFEKPLTALFQEAIRIFWDLREEQRISWRKKPSTSELIDWVQALERDEQAQGSTDEQPQGLTAETLASTPISELPHLGVLAKTESDLLALKNL